MHQGAKNVSREERVKQVVNKEASVSDFVNYIPISQAVIKLNFWVDAGAEIYYLTSRTDDQVDDIFKVLTRHKFPTPTNLYHRIGLEEYTDVVNKIQPNVLIEDDCESIGGLSEMISPTLSDNIQKIVVKEFEGIDKLANDIAILMNHSGF